MGKIHGMYKSPTYSSWLAMKKRCKPNGDHHQWYAARGIVVCERWERFEDFLSDMGERPNGTELDRIDNNGIYCKQNCRWATRLENARNRTNTFRVRVGMDLLILRNLVTDIRADTIKMRLRRGWSIDRALSIPVKRLDK